MQVEKQHYTQRGDNSMFSKTGIDISHHQHTINFSELKNDSRVTFALLKTGGSDASGEALYKDNMFESYYSES